VIRLLTDTGLIYTYPNIVQIIQKNGLYLAKANSTILLHPMIKILVYHDSWVLFSVISIICLVYHTAKLLDNLNKLHK